MATTSLQGKVFRLGDLTGPLAILTGTRPGIVKFSPILRELDRRGTQYRLIHSGQHYSPEMDAIFFEEMDLRAPDYKLDVVRHFPLHGEQTAEMLRGIERILIGLRPSLLLVGGDCNTHLAGALAGRKLHVPIGHVEAGMRSYDWRMPEEHNRVMIDHISDHLFVHDQSAADVLTGERVRGRIHVVGTTIADAVSENVRIARDRSCILCRLSVRPQEYFLGTTHREENADDPEKMAQILAGLEAIGERYRMPVILPAHPRTQRRIGEFGLDVDQYHALKLVEPLGYLDFLSLLADARAVLTDSGGVQQEACILHVPCVTLRASTEWVETVRLGANRLCEPEPVAMLEAVAAAAAAPRTWPVPFGAGAAARLVDRIMEL